MGSSKKNSDLEFVVEAKFVGGEFRASNEIKDYSWLDVEALKATFEVFNYDITGSGVLNGEYCTSTYSVVWE